MNNQNLQFNILPIEWPKEHERVYNEKPEFIKQYYNREIYQYFKNRCGRLVRTSFINQNQIWLPSGKNNTEELYAFECFSLKVQVQTVSDGPELLITYDGQAKVLKQSVASIIQKAPPSCLNWIRTDHRLVRYKDFAREEDADYEHAYPVLNNALRRNLGMPAPAPDKNNRYQKHYTYIKGFCRKYLDTEEFKSIIPFNNNFMPADPQLVYRIDQCLNELHIEKGMDRASKNSIQKLKPYKKSPHPHIHMFFLAHKKHQHLIETVKCYFFQGIGGFKGLGNYAGMNIYPDKELDIIFSNHKNPLLEIEDQLDENASKWDTHIKYIAVYISPYTRWDPDEEKREIYYHVKQALLDRCITTQVLTAKKLCDTNIKYEYCLPHIAVAMLAKLDGIPWRLQMPVKNELIIGMGAFERKEDKVQYISSAFCFNTEGRFNRFECFLKHEINMFTGYITYALKRYIKEHDFPSRMVIHFYKKISQKELAPIQEAIEALQFPKPLPIFIISVNKTESEDILAFDTDSTELMPYSGTIVRVAEHEYLIYNNTRYPNDSFDRQKGYPLPIKVGVECTDKKQLKDKEVVWELVSQVYQFSKMYWKSLRQQNLPVTVKYPEMVAKMLPNFKGGRMPEFGKRNLWFL